MSKTREAWLESGVIELAARLFKRVGYEVPEKIKVSCSWPHKNGTAARQTRVGECWSPVASAAGNHEIMISHLIDDSLEVLSVLTHEVVHAVVGVEAGHKAAFRRCALAVGLTGKMTATTAGDELQAELKRIIETLGEYPHARLNPELSGRKKQTTRLVKVQCPDCGYAARVTRRWLDEVGAPICPCNNTPMNEA